ncbi:MAG: hypothetical protein JNK82_04780 [Myxococcaceae bacterium]|nr:hypothetical protein [Myxococcaceae bacterium]
MDLVLELLLNGLGELILEVVFRSKADQHPIGRAVSWLMLGLLFGWASTLVFTGHFIHSEGLRQANLVVSPLFFAGVSGVVASARKKPAWPAALGAALFSLAFAVVRWRFAT